MTVAVSGHSNTQRSAPAFPLVRPAQPMLLVFVRLMTALGVPAERLLR